MKKVRCAGGNFGNLTGDYFDQRREFCGELLGVVTVTTPTTDGLESSAAAVVADGETGRVVTVPLADWTVTVIEYTRWTNVAGSRGEPMTVTEVWTDGRDERHESTFAASAWGRETVSAETIPADAEAFGPGAWRRVTVTYPE